MKPDDDKLDFNDARPVPEGYGPRHVTPPEWFKQGVERRKAELEAQKNAPRPKPEG